MPNISFDFNSTEDLKTQVADFLKIPQIISGTKEIVEHKETIIREEKLVPQPVPTPEYFGAFGDGEHDDLYAIQKCLETFGKCYLDNKIYGISDSIILNSGNLLIGKGKSLSTIKLLDGAAGAQKKNRFNLIKTPSHIVNYNDIVIKDLYINCNFENQDHQATINAICLYGSNNLIDGIKATNFSCGTGDQSECFVISAATAFATYKTLKGNTVRNCEITQPANLSGINYQASPPPLNTLIAVGGSYIDNTSIGDIIENNYVHDFDLDEAKTKCYTNCFTMGNNFGGQVVNNVAQNVYGMGYYQDTYNSDDLLIANNNFLNVKCAISFYQSDAGAGQIGGGTYKNVVITNNNIRTLGNNAKFLNAFYPHDQGGISINARGRTHNFTITDNIIRGSQFLWGQTPFQPYGIQIWQTTGTYEKILIKDNIIDVQNKNNYFNNSLTLNKTNFYWGWNVDGFGNTVQIGIRSGNQIVEWYNKIL